MSTFGRKPETEDADASVLEKLSDRYCQKGSDRSLCDASHSRTADQEQRRQWRSAHLVRYHRVCRTHCECNDFTSTPYRTSSRDVLCPRASYIKKSLNYHRK
jgi:hypothetical protein